MPFTKADMRRVQRLFDEAVTDPYEAIVSLSNSNTVMTVAVADPANEALNVVNCSFRFNPAAAAAKTDQPRSVEVMTQCAEFAAICAEYVTPGG
jgi:hypothetical protein